MLGSTSFARLATAIVLGVCATTIDASSQRPPPLHPRGLSYPSDIAIQVLPKRQVAPPAGDAEPYLRARSLSDTDSSFDAAGQPAWDDSFLLSFVAHDQPITLSLRPSTTLLHPSGIKEVHTHTDENGVRSTTTRWIQREQVRAYEGWVVEDAEDDQKRSHWVNEEIAGVRREHSVRNWARIVLHDANADSILEDGEDTGEIVAPVFAGSFSLDDELYSVHSTPSYLRTKDSLDPEPPLLRKRSNLFGSALSHPSMVVVKERELLTPIEHINALRRRGLPLPSADAETMAGAVPVHSCGHDHLDFNTDPSHPVYEHALDQAVFGVDLSSGSSVTPWIRSVFGMPARSAPPASFIKAENGAQAVEVYGYPLHPKLVRRQSGGDVANTGNTSATSNFINSIGSSAGCPKSATVLFIGVAADCTFAAQYSSADQARTTILTDFNTASSLYQSSFNVSLGIVELNVQSGACPTTSAQVDASNPWNVGCEEGGGPGLNLNDRLSVFSAWRGQKGGADGAGLWHLLTNCSTGSEVGVAWLGQLCRVSSSRSSMGSTTSGTGVTSITRSVWQVIAHEIGHNFGAIHDCAAGCSLSGSCCPLSRSTCNADANYIMSPVSSRNVSTFSPCTIGNVCSSLSNSLNTTCLATPGRASNPTVISLRACGNGIVEASEGEECDPGSNVNDPCCNAATCKFAAGAVCDPLNSLCCTSTCQLASAGTVCRASLDATCDRAETCSGTNSTCPADSYENDGTNCGNGLACASGVCTSRSAQCQTAGASLGLTSACPTRASDSCSISCQDPTSISSCVVLDQSFRDGTPCGYAGRCENSACVSGNGLEAAKSWYRQNLQISIPVTIVAAIIVLLLLIAIWRCCARRGRGGGKTAPSARFVGAPVGAAAAGSRRNRRGHNSSLAVPAQPNGSSGDNSLASNQAFFGPPQPAHQQGGSRVLRRGAGDAQPPYYAPQQPYQPPPPPQHPSTQQYGGGWVDPAGYNGAGYNGQYPPQNQQWR